MSESRQRLGITSTEEFAIDSQFMRSRGEATRTKTTYLNLKKGYS
jgi:hypothetical protein